MGREAGPRRLVRNVEMERRRRLYASFQLEELLRERAISADEIFEEGSLPLEIFDDEEFDCRCANPYLARL